MSILPVANLGLGPGAWLFLSWLGALVLFFKFGRLWSLRNFDLVLLFAPAPGLFRLVAGGTDHPWWAFVLLLAGSGLWLARCLIDLALSRRPILEPNLNEGGLGLLLCGMLGLMLVEAVLLPIDQGTARNPADTNAKPETSPTGDEPNTISSGSTDLRPPPALVLLRRLLSILGHLGIASGLLLAGWRAYGRLQFGLSMAGCYLVLPYARIALIDPGQLIPAALIAWAVAEYRRVTLAAVLIGLSAAWMPATSGLIPLWAAFYRGRGGLRFLLVSMTLLGIGGAAGLWLTPLSLGARALGARTLAEAGLSLTISDPQAGSFWKIIDPAFRLPVLVAYLAMVITFTIWPLQKDLAHLVGLSAALLVGSQFWYLEEGGTHVVLYLPLILLMIFRPNLTGRRPPLRPAGAARAELEVSHA